jgi:tetratricopeptide (TPR) repeat protein
VAYLLASARAPTSRCRLGTHRLAAGQANKALEPLLEAGATMLAEGRTALALSAGALAVDAADSDPGPRCADRCRRHVAEVLLELDRIDEAASTLDDIEALGQIDRRTKAIVRILHGRVATARGELELAQKLFQEAATWLEAMRDVEGLTDALHGQAIVLRLAGRPREAMERYDRMATLGQGNALVGSRALGGNARGATRDRGDRRRRRAARAPPPDGAADRRHVEHRACHAHPRALRAAVRTARGGGALVPHGAGARRRRSAPTRSRSPATTTSESSSDSGGS